MEGASSSSYKGLGGYWKRREYERLNGSGRRRKNRVQLATLGSNRRRRFWRIKMKPKLRFFNFAYSPKKFFQNLRDMYVKMMLGFAHSRVFNSGFGSGDNGSLGYGFGKVPLKDYDEKLVVQIYKSLMTQQQLMSCDAAKPAEGIVCNP